MTLTSKSCREKSEINSCSFVPNIPMPLERKESSGTSPYSNSEWDQNGVFWHTSCKRDIFIIRNGHFSYSTKECSHVNCDATYPKKEEDPCDLMKDHRGGHRSGKEWGRWTDHQAEQTRLRIMQMIHDT